MNFRSNKGVISEVLMFVIIIMLVALVGIIGIYVYNCAKIIDSDNVAVTNQNNNPNKMNETTTNKTSNVINNNIVNNATTADLNTIFTQANNYDNTVNRYVNTTAIAKEPQTTYIANTYPNNYKRFYYNQISDLGKQLYDILFDAKYYLKSGTYIIDVPTSVSDVLYQSDGKQVLTESFQEAIDAFRMDNPEMFYIAFNEIVLTTETTTYGNTVTYALRLENKEGDNYLAAGLLDEADALTVINNAEYVKKQVLSGAYGNDYEKIKYVHDWIVENIEYDSSTVRQNTHNAYGALVEREAVCDGYSRAFKFLMDELGIPCIVVQGYATNSEGYTESHAWNDVMIDGNWYAIDTTWDDPLIEGWSGYETGYKYRYFLKGRENFYSDHQETGSVSEKGFAFSYPELSYYDF